MKQGAGLLSLRYLVYKRLSLHRQLNETPCDASVDGRKHQFYPHKKDGQYE